MAGVSELRLQEWGAGLLKKSVIGLLVLGVSLMLAEFALRLQQKLGPLCDLKLKHINWNESAELAKEGKEIENHAPVEIGDWKYDENRLLISTRRPHRYAAPPGGLSVLFMGDSFMQGVSQKDNVPQVVWNEIPSSILKSVPFTILNAGSSSYSPSIFIVQAKRLIPFLRPDYLVISIDETDLGDDGFRYRHLIERDVNGRIIAVRPSPLYRLFMTGLAEIRTSPLYIVRLVRKVYHTRIRMPRLIARYGKDHLQLVIQKDRSKNAKVKYAETLGFFERVVDELAETATLLMGDPSKILFIHHPHLGHLKPEGGRYWPGFVSEIVARAASRKKIAYYDATHDLEKIFGDQPEGFYVHGDMHLNARGIQAYGALVAKRLFSMIEKDRRRSRRMAQQDSF